VTKYVPVRAVNNGGLTFTVYLSGLLKFEL
jgi:hypothetical protein